MSSMAPAVWYRLGSPLGSALPRCCPDLAEEPPGGAAVVAVASSAAAGEKSGSSVGDLLRRSARLSQLSPVGEPGIPAERGGQGGAKGSQRGSKRPKKSHI